MDIKKEREKIGMTQEEFGILLGVSRKTISTYESSGNIPETKEKAFSSILSNYSQKNSSQNINSETKKLANECVKNWTKLMEFDLFKNKVENEALKLAYQMTPKIIEEFRKEWEKNNVK